MNFCKKNYSLGILIITTFNVKGKMTSDDCIFLYLWFSISRNNFFSFVYLHKFQATVHSLICYHFAPRKMAVNDPIFVI